MPEYWDIYDNNRINTGRTHQRGVPLPVGDYHVVVSVWTVNQENKFLLTLRSHEKELFPGQWENTSGSVISGETSRQAALRELSEETGIVATDEELRLLANTRKASSFVDIYLVHKHVDPSSIRLQEGETISYQWVSLPELEEIYQQGLLAFPVAFRFEQLHAFFEGLLG